MPCFKRPGWKGFNSHMIKISQAMECVAEKMKTKIGAEYTMGHSGSRNNDMCMWFVQGITNINCKVAPYSDLDIACAGDFIHLCTNTHAHLKTVCDAYVLKGVLQWDCCKICEGSAEHQIGFAQQLPPIRNCPDQKWDLRPKRKVGKYFFGKAPNSHFWAS